MCLGRETTEGGHPKILATTHFLLECFVQLLSHNKNTGPPVNGTRAKKSGLAQPRPSIVIISADES